MSSRRVPLTSNPHAANSPMRAVGGLKDLAKHKRSYANTQREDAYGQPPPDKKQVLDNRTGRPVRSPSKLPRAQSNLVQRMAASHTSTTSRPPIRERTTSKLATTKAAQDEEHKEMWKKHYRAKFPKMVFYFENIPDDVRAKLTKRIGVLGARQEPFFSNDVTHVITTRPIPSERSENQTVEQQEPEPQPEPEPQEQPQTINPSLLDRNTAARRKLLFEFRNVPSRSQLSQDPTRPNRGARNNDVLHKAMEMGKKIWSLDKFSTMVSVLLESEMQENAQISRTTSTRGPHGTAKPQESNLLQLLHNERVNGPSDRDLATSNKELIHFKGPFVYIYDMDEKSKPIMVREYSKVTSKADGDWPQFRSVGNGRCPFVEEVEYTTKEERKPQEQDQQAPKAIGKRQEGTTMLKAPTAPSPMPVTGKRTLTEMEDGHNKGGKLRAVLNPARAALSKQAFLSRAPSGRVHQGEPVASGLQASNVTSAIRSQMISSTSGLTGVKAGTSKEIHGLQRQVLQKAAPGSHGTSSRLAEQSVEGTSSRSMSISRQTSKVGQRQPTSSQRLEMAAPAQPLKSKKDLKPGYCENCQDKFRDFDEHILTRKHRKFAENDENWADLDDLLKDLVRLPKDHMLDQDDCLY